MEQILKSGYLCNHQQVYTLRRVTINEGKAKGASVIEVSTAGGLQVDILPDSGMDIGQVRYKGVNMTFISKNGYDCPSSFTPWEDEFLRTFPGGLLYTCGMRTAGGGHRDDNGEWQPFHGRYHGLQADQIAAFVEDNTIIIKGTIRETALFGCCMELRRTIRIPVMGAEISIEDTITNQAHLPEEYMMLYHCNFGYPFLSDKARVELPEDRKTTARTEFAVSGLGKEHTFDAPTPGEEERVFFHENMERTVSIVNEEIGAKMTLCWGETLPILVHWRSMASGDYACGLEPTNCYIMGRKDERDNGTLPVLQPYESVKTQLHFRFDSI